MAFTIILPPLANDWFPVMVKGVRIGKRAEGFGEGDLHVRCCFPFPFALDNRSLQLVIRAETGGCLIHRRAVLEREFECGLSRGLAFVVQNLAPVNRLTAQCRSSCRTDDDLVGRSDGQSATGKAESNRADGTVGEGLLNVATPPTRAAVVVPRSGPLPKVTAAVINVLLSVVSRLP